MCCSHRAVNICNGCCFRKALKLCVTSISVKLGLLIMGWSMLSPSSQLPSLLPHSIIMPWIISRVRLYQHTWLLSLATASAVVNAFTIQLYLYTACWILVWVAIFVDWLKGPFTIVRKVLQEAILSSLSAPPPFIGSLNWSQLASQFPHYFPKYWFSPTPSATAKEVNMLYKSPIWTKQRHFESQMKFWTLAVADLSSASVSLSMRSLPSLPSGNGGKENHYVC